MIDFGILVWIGSAISYITAILVSLSIAVSYGNIRGFGEIFIMTSIIAAHFLCNYMWLYVDGVGPEMSVIIWLFSAVLVVGFYRNIKIRGHQLKPLLYFCKRINFSRNECEYIIVNPLSNKIVGIHLNRKSEIGELMTDEFCGKFKDIPELITEIKRIENTDSPELMFNYVRENLLSLVLATKDSYYITCLKEVSQDTVGEVVSDFLIREQKLQSSISHNVSIF